ncbi:MAG: PEGA domain-containing protein, partial [Bradymonadaceae bacterium]
GVGGEFAEGLGVVSGGEVTIEELSVTVGCNELNPDCLAGLSEYVDARRMVFGSVERSDDVYLFTVKLFDFTEERFVRQLAERTVEGEPSVVKRAIPAVVESFLYGDVGTLEVAVSNAQSPRVYFDGEKMGPAPTTLQNLPLGQHAVTVKTQDGREKTQFVMLRKDKPQTVDFTFEGGGEQVSSGGGNTPVLALSSLGVGVVGTTIGVIGGARWLKFDNELDRFRGCSNGLCPLEGKSPAETSAAFRETKTKYEQSALLANIGFGVGALGLGVGGYLLIRHLTSGSSGTESKPKALDSFRVSPRRGGLSVGVSGSF